MLRIQRGVSETREAVLTRRFARAVSEAIDSQDAPAWEIADLLGLSESVLSRYRNGHVAPSIGRAVFIASALGLSLDALVED